MFSADIRIDESIERMLGRIEHATDPDIIAELVADPLLQFNLERFLNESGPDGPWPPSARGERRKAGIPTKSSVTGGYYAGTGTLFESGTLFDSIDVAQFGTTVELYFTAAHGVVHHLGLHGNPQRKIIGFTDSDLDYVSSVIQDLLGDV